MLAVTAAAAVAAAAAAAATGPGAPATGTPAPVCPGYKAVVDETALAATPRADEEAELVALGLADRLVASTPDYERVKADLAAIRAARPELAEATHAHWDDAQSLIVVLAPAAFERVKSGAKFPAWDCANRAYGLVHSAVDEEGGYAFLQFKGRYKLSVLARVYGKIRGVTSVAPNSMMGAGTRVCARKAGATFHYLFAVGSGDCPAGCMHWDHTYVYTTAPAKPVHVATWDAAAAAPAAAKLAPSCPH